MIPTYLKRPDGSLYINPAKRHVRTFWLSPLESDVITIPANGKTKATYEISTEGHFEINSLIFESDDPQIKVNIFDNGTRRNLMNRPVVLPTIAGTGERPFYWPETYFMNVVDGPRSLTVEFEDFSGADNDVRMIFAGRRWYFNEATPDVQLEMQKKFGNRERTNVYFLTTEEDIIIPANDELVDAQAPRFEATDEADTEIKKLTRFSTSGEFEVRFRELRSNRALSNGFIHASNVFGDAEFPFVMPETLLLERNYDLAMDIRNLIGIQNDIFITATARRLYY